MTVLTIPISTVKLPVQVGHPPEKDMTSWGVVLDVPDFSPGEPWILPCSGCAVIDSDGGRIQAGCDDCRGRGWFDTSTGLPVKLWWVWFDAATHANWVLREVVPTLLRAAGYEEDADRVLTLPTLTAAMLTRKRLIGTGLLEDITARVEADWWGRLEVSPSGGRRLVPASPRFSHGPELHPVLLRASEARWDFTTSKLGWWAYRVVWAGVDLLRARKHHGDTTVVEVKQLLDEIDHEWRKDHPPLLLVEADRLDEPGPDSDPELVPGSPRRDGSAVASSGVI